MWWSGGRCGAAMSKLSHTDPVVVADAAEWAATLPAGSVQCCVTSPPYFGLRDYGEDGQIGLEDTWPQYVDRLVEVFAGIRRALRSDGVLLLNLGDSYYNRRTHNNGGMVANSVHRGQMNGNPDGARRCGRRAVAQPGLKDKDLIGIPWRVAFALQSDGWWLRQEIRWIKPNPLPDKFRDRCLDACESVFLLSKSPRYYFDSRAIAATNAGGQPCPPANAWTIQARSTKGHHAAMPPELARRLVLCSSRPGDIVVDPFTGSGTTGVAAVGHGRRFHGCDLSPEYAKKASQRISGGPLFARISSR